MWKSVKLHFSVSNNFKDFLKSADFIRGFRIQFCFQILTLEVEKYRFKPKMKIDFWEKNAIFDQK